MFKDYLYHIFNHKIFSFRPRLYDLLSEESLSFEKELREQNDRSADHEFNDRLKKMLEMKRNSDLEHKHFIENKQMQQQL